MGRRRDEQAARNGHQAPLIVDAGPLIALDRGDLRARALLGRVDNDDRPIIIPAGALAQAWRDGSRQVALSRLLQRYSTTIAPLDLVAAKAVGRLLARTRTRDVVDAHLALVAQARGGTIVTGDADDIRRLAPNVEIERF